MAYDNRSVSPLKIQGSPYKKGEKGKAKLYTKAQLEKMGANMDDYVLVITRGGRASLYKHKDDKGEVMGGGSNIKMPSPPSEESEEKGPKWKRLKK